MSPADHPRGGCPSSATYYRGWCPLHEKHQSGYGPGTDSAATIHQCAIRARIPHVGRRRLVLASVTR